ncbi:MAG: 30S ribosomal protein S2 [Candidatus Micrarchaeales archaeon]
MAEGMVEEVQEQRHDQSQLQLLVNQNDYLEVGVHIATKVKSAGMKRFIYKVREDGLYLLDLKTIDNKIRVAANMIAMYDPKDVVVTASRIYAIVAAEKFANIIGAKFIKGRVTPGIFTNPHRDDYMEAKLIMISDSRNEKQAIKEASMKNIPIIALSDTDNSTKFVDLIIPSNNRGRKSLAFIYYLLAREVLKARSEIKSSEEFNFKTEDFESKSEPKSNPRSEQQY